jgi:arylsulfatase A-like enzyme
MDSGGPTRREFLQMMAAASVIGAGKLVWPKLPATQLTSDLSAVNQLAVSGDRPNILLLAFDTLSASHIGLHGYRRDTMPNLTRIAEQATVYHRHYATGNFTSPATASMLTGTHPWRHRAFHLHGIVETPFIQDNLFKLMGAAGYHRFAYTHNLLVMSLLHQFRDSLDLFKLTRELCLRDEQLADRLFFDDYNVAFWSEWLMMRGGDTPSSLFVSLLDRLRRFANKRAVTADFDQLFPLGLPNLHSLYFVLEDAVDWMLAEMEQAPRPFMGYVHLLPPHEPYTTRRDFVDSFRDGWQPEPKEEHYFSEQQPQTHLNVQRRAYDEYIAYVDAEVGRFYDQLVRQELLDNTYLIITSDHGELFERGIRGHVTPTLYEPLLHVPLLVAGGGQQTRQDIYQPTSGVDFLPTLLSLAGLPLPEWAEGQILPGLGGPVESERPIYAVEAKSNPKQAPLTRATISLVMGDYKLIHYAGHRRLSIPYELYDLAADPEERNDLFTQRPSLANDLQHLLQQKLTQVNASIPA